MLQSLLKLTRFPFHLFLRYRRLIFRAGIASVLVVFACDFWVGRFAKSRIHQSVESVPEKPVALVLGTARVFVSKFMPIISGIG